ncbi:MAG: hypothetical protein ACXAD7_25280, partial [Candidatus Kariarchaeaceae archaeon]
FTLYITVDNDKFIDVQDLKFTSPHYDPQDFDTFPVSLQQDPVYTIEHIDNDQDGDTDWLEFSFQVTTRISGTYQLLMDVFYGEVFGLLIDQSVQVSSDQVTLGVGTHSLKILLSGSFLAMYAASKITITSLHIYDVQTDYQHRLNLPDPIGEVEIDFEDYNLQIIDIPTTLQKNDQLSYTNVDPFTYVLEIQGFTINIQQVNATYVQYTQHYTGFSYGEVTEIAFFANSSTRYLGHPELGFFIYQLDPSKLSLGSWFWGFLLYDYGNLLLPAQIISSKLISFNDKTIDTWVAFDGFNYYYYEKLSGVLVLHHPPSFQPQLQLESTNKLFNYEAETSASITPTTSTSTSTSTGKKSNGGFLDLHFHAFIISLLITGYQTKKKYMSRV